MSFVFPSWETAFSPSFYDDAKAMLETALNKGNKPPVIQGHIQVVDLNMGSQPPTLTLLEIGDLSLDRFRGILRLGYQGDAWITVRCLVQANPLSHNPNLIPSSTLPISTPLLASQPLLVPMTLQLSKLHLRAILILVVSKAKGITLVFKNDPLQNVDVSSTFDSVEVIRGYLQQEIEGQLREMFREDLPGIIHRLSQKWFSSQGGTVETPYREEHYDTYEEETIEDRERERERDVHGAPSVASTAQSTPKRKALHRAAAMRSALSESPTSYTVFPDIENYDPTYGLRPEGLPTHSGYEAFGRLWEKARVGGGRGLGSLMGGEEEEENNSDEDSVSDDENEATFRMDHHVEEEQLQRTPPRFVRQTSVMSSVSHTTTHTAWETFPAVGGGVVTRPRVFHSQSQIRPPSESGFSAMPSPAGTTGTATGGSDTARASSIGTSTIGSLREASTYVPAHSHHAPHTPLPPLRRTMTNASRQTHSRPESMSALALQHSLAAYNLHSPRPSPMLRAQSMRAQPRNHSRSGSSTRPTSPPPVRRQNPPRPMSMDAMPLADEPRRPRAASLAQLPGRGITLPLNNSVSQLATLSLSANTLSPYARAHEHIAVRSFPHLGRGGSAPGHLREDGTSSTPEVKARRKRIFRLGGSSRQPSLSPDIDVDDRTPPLEWDDDRIATSSSGGVVRTAPSAGMSAPPSAGASRSSRSSRGFPFPKIPE